MNDTPLWKSGKTRRNGSVETNGKRWMGEKVYSTETIAKVNSEVTSRRIISLWRWKDVSDSEAKLSLKNNGQRCG